MAEAVKWGARGARINSISPGIMVTPLPADEFNGPCGGSCKDMFAKCLAGRPVTGDGAGVVVGLPLGDKGSLITGSTSMGRSARPRAGHAG